MPFCQMVMGPAGTGKSTYCRIMQEHCANARRKVHVANLDPAAEQFEYEVAFDIRDLITLEDVMEELKLGPNGALVYCMEYLLDNTDWLKDEMDQYDDDEYLIFDCPGQVELYSHIPVMRSVISQLTAWDHRVCGVYCLDATFLADPAKFVSGMLLTLSAMVQLQLPHVNVLTKCDIADKEEVERLLDAEGTAGILGLDSRTTDLTPTGPVGGGGSRGRGGEEGGVGGEEGGVGGEAGHGGSAAAMEEGAACEGSDNAIVTGEAEAEETGAESGAASASLEGAAAPSAAAATAGELRSSGPPVLARLTAAISSIVDDYMMVGFVPLDASDEDSVALVLQHADHVMQYGEGLEPREPVDVERDLMADDDT